MHNGTQDDIKQLHAVAGRQCNQGRGIGYKNHAWLNPLTSSSNSTRLMLMTGIWLALQRDIKPYKSSSASSAALASVTRPR